MRLSKIKLAGFKSFVDPTSIPLPSNLVGVIGPNGCGKSNVIDAVRWVMGETSAKNLRGDSMADVIFNGSTARKPVGQATIELVFDNTDSSLGGQWAEYNEISVKRTVTRDGQSNYFLNGSRCRRKDIVDIFLGTGLGPRSYAIIEQGTISRLIEAKPEELRIYLEEAAGISKYKERRRETENRIKHTRENLDRLTDLRDELGKQLAHLQRQAKTAERFTALKVEERLVKAQLQALRWQKLDTLSGEQERALSELETDLEAEIAKQRNLEAELESLREQHVDAGDAFNSVQGRFYAVGADIARLEQSIQHAKERRQEQESNLSQVERSVEEAQVHLEADQSRVLTLESELQVMEPELAEAREKEQLATATMQEAEQAMQGWQQQWDEFNQGAGEPARNAEVERTRIQHLEQQQYQVDQRRERLQQELQNLSPAELEQTVAQLQEQLLEVEARIEAQEEQLQNLLESINRQRQDNQETNKQLNAQRSELQNLQGRRASLEALQQAALGQSNAVVNGWLQNQGLDKAQRLAQGLNVENGWERAVECVLGQYLEAICVDDLGSVSGALDALTGGSVTLFAAAAGGNGSGDAQTLLSKVSAPWNLQDLLAGVYVADNLPEALARRSNLAPHESIVTRDGLWLGGSWLRVVREEDAHSGVLQREKELKEIVAQLESCEARVEGLQMQLEQGQEALRNQEQERESAQAQVNQVRRQSADIKAQLGGKQARLEQVHDRRAKIEQEIGELREQIDASQDEVSQARARLEQSLEEMERINQQRESLNRQRDELRQQLDQSRGQSRLGRDIAHDLNVQLQSKKVELNSTRQNLQRMLEQLQQMEIRREELRAALLEGEDPIGGMAEELAVLLEQRRGVEQELTEARKKVEEIEFSMRELAGERNRFEQKAQALRSKVEHSRMAWQETKVRRQGVTEQIDESDFELQVLLDEMPESANEELWQEQLDGLTRRIQSLGPINLAAIEEFKEQSERKTYLDAQNEDLMKALETLENAIRKIDKETRTRFKETFDAVNSGLQAMFPRLFGGGHAYLELTGEDLLETGVSIMARPPGKRNSSIHLLSGGEKALTAIALVFSMFELNPAPFCMLDEVDAPLDEANVGRFSNLVKEMSERVQFIFITHNKVTMEIAHQLNGVTMHEPGVSRLVAVDVDQAVEMVAAG